LSITAFQIDSYLKVLEHLAENTQRKVGSGVQFALECEKNHGLLTKALIRRLNGELNIVTAVPSDGSGPAYPSTGEGWAMMDRLVTESSDVPPDAS
jgi:hypothetical protein